MKRTWYCVAVVSALFCHPLFAQRNARPAPQPVDTTVVIQDLPPAVCPIDRRDGPLMADGYEFYGIAARKIVEGFLAPGFNNADPWRYADVGSLRILDDGRDYDACLRLTMSLTGGARSAPAPEPWVYFTSGGFYFVSAWKPAQSLSNYSTSYGHVIVYDSAFNYLGAFAF